MGVFTVGTGGIANDKLSCKKCFDDLYYCATPGYQFNCLFKDGELDACTGKLKDFLKCLRAKTMNEEEAQVYMKGTQGDMTRKQHQAEVWKLKEIPSWDN